jgi:hypothetical protein
VLLIKKIKRRYLMLKKIDKILVVLIGIVLTAIAITLIAKERSYLPRLPHFQNLVPSWETVIISYVLLITIAIVLFVLVARRRKLTQKTASASTDATPVAVTPKQKGAKSWSRFIWGLVIVAVVVSAIIWSGKIPIKMSKIQSLITKTSKTAETPMKIAQNQEDNDTGQNTKTVKTPQFRPLPQNGSRMEIIVNKNSWVPLPQSKSGKFRFQPEDSSVVLLVRCTNFRADGTSQVIKTVEFGGRAGLCVLFPTCEEYSLRLKTTNNTREAMVYWWED